MSDAITGRCLCSAVQFTIAPTAAVSVCHCKMCRRWCGGLPLAGVQAKVNLRSGEKLRWWKSSAWGDRGFCGDCGASLFWRASGEAEWEIAVGALDEESGLKIERHIYIDDKCAFYEFADAAPRQTGAEFTAFIFSQLREKYGEEFLADALTKTRAQNGDAFADEVTRLLAK